MPATSAFSLPPSPESTSVHMSSHFLRTRSGNFSSASQSVTCVSKNPRLHACSVSESCGSQGRLGRLGVDRQLATAPDRVKAAVTVARLLEVALLLGRVIAPGPLTPDLLLLHQLLVGVGLDLALRVLPDGRRLVVDLRWQKGVVMCENACSRGG